MSIRNIGGAEVVGKLPARAPAGVGHAHFWERAISRRKLFGSAAGAAGALVASSALGPAKAWAGNSDPKPIPGGMVVGGQGYHVFLPGEGAEPSTITDLNGVVGIMQTGGTGVGRQGGVVAPFPFEVDVRFMQGKYIAADGKLRNGTFAFI